MREIGINLHVKPDVCAIEFIKQAAKFGFNTLFTNTPDERGLHIIANTLAANGMRYETIHAPFSHINDMWLDGEDGDAMLREMTVAVDRCRTAGVPILVVHLSSGNTPPPISDVGFIRYTCLVEYAAQKGIKIAFENQRKPDRLAWAFEKFGRMPHVGFCFDCGHENCFTPGVQFLPLYGDRLLCTHIHDNDCVREHDLHMLPFDGRSDFGRVTRQLRESGYKGPLTLEIHTQNSDKYNFMTLQAFLERAAMSIKRLRSMLDF
jgi:sugar phosphate isomerase/epimerase